MKTQISRHSHRPEKRYSGVYQQQGRMITDADWNELVEILKERLAEALRDVVTGGAPRERGMAIVPGEEPRGEFPDPFAIRGGWLYADGVAARMTPAASVTGDTFRFDQQADFPSPPPLPEAGSYQIYADVWERPVAALEDDPHLRDPALHGADTTTRTQTMAQVKWCQAQDDLDDLRVNPPRGNAELRLRLRPRREEADPCDPCADEVAVATRTGNYLFRLEVHDVAGLPGAASKLTLKWSSENGAEQHEVERAPSELKTGDWIYEFYSETSEKHLGVHLAPDFEPVRWPLEPGWPKAPPADAPWVRRWDGYCVLERDARTWRLAAGKDRATELSTEGSADTDGHVTLAGNRLEIQLETMTLTLRLDRLFVAGDYWLAPVREAVHQTGSVVLEDTPPLGIVHHYLPLAEVDREGHVVEPTTDERRRLSFPPLTDLQAGDVGYATGCDPAAGNPLFNAGHDTVKKALDRICQIAAQNVAYAPECKPDAADPLFDAKIHDTVKKALDRICQLTAGHVGYAPPEDCKNDLFNAMERQTIKDALDGLCELSARHVGYAPAPECEDLRGADTVQEALDALCQRPTGGSVSREIVQPGHGFRVGDAIRFDVERDLYVKARADDAATTGLFLVSEAKGEEFTLLQAGYLDLEAGYEPDPVPRALLLLPGHYYFVSAEREGALTPEEPPFGVSNPILYADGATGGYVLPWRPSLPSASQLGLQGFFDLMRPVGDTYVQWHGAEDPNVLFNRGGLRSTWVDSDVPPGAFIRARGGGANVAADGKLTGEEQLDQVQSHKHNDAGHWHYRNPEHDPELAWRNVRQGGHGVPAPGPDSYHNLNRVEPAKANLGDPTATSAGKVRHGAETRPRNVAAVFWRRIA